ncbi:MAG: hypothetical protein EZS28_049938, partial [Streblomastix strix]
NKKQQQQQQQQTTEKDIKQNHNTDDQSTSDDDGQSSDSSQNSNDESIDSEQKRINLEKERIEKEKQIERQRIKMQLLQQQKEFNSKPIFKKAQVSSPQVSNQSTQRTSIDPLLQQFLLQTPISQILALYKGKQLCYKGLDVNYNWCQQISILKRNQVSTYKCKSLQYEYEQEPEPDNIISYLTGKKRKLHQSE